MVIDSGGMFLDPVHEAESLARSSACRKHKSPRGCVTGAEALGWATIGYEMYNWVRGVSSGTRPRPVQRPSPPWDLSRLKGGLPYLLIRVRGEGPSLQLHLLCFSKKKDPPAPCCITNPRWNEGSNTGLRNYQNHYHSEAAITEDPCKSGKWASFILSFLNYSSLRPPLQALAYSVPLYLIPIPKLLDQDHRISELLTEQLLSSVSVKIHSPWLHRNSVYWGRQH